jgi:hypothetical protein
MIQRKQTLFLFQLIFLGIALLFVPVSEVTTTTGKMDVYLVPLRSPLVSTSGHITAIAINFVALMLTFITIFLYKRRELQVKLCYALMVLWIILSLMMAFCPFVERTDVVIEIKNNYFGPIIGAFAVVAAFIAARFIKKDIELLKSADRIR